VLTTHQRLQHTNVTGVTFSDSNSAPV